LLRANAVGEQRGHDATILLLGEERSHARGDLRTDAAQAREFFSLPDSQLSRQNRYKGFDSRRENVEPFSLVIPSGQFGFKDSGVPAFLALASQPDELT